MLIISVFETVVVWQLWFHVVLLAKIKILLFLEMRVTRKIFTRVVANFLFDNQFNWIFQIKFTLKELLKQHFYLLKNKDSYLLLFKEKKRQFLQINFLVENCLNGEFYWPNVFHYEFKIQSLLWTLHCRSQIYYQLAHLKNIDKSGF